MNLKLKNLFPFIKTKKEIIDEINSTPKLSSMYHAWEENQQNEFLDICTGVKGVKILYDTFFKEILNPDTVPERLNSLLSLLLGETVRILKVLPTDSPRFADEKSLLTMDIVVELEDGRIANVEVQKIGYKFPGQRSACYSSDLLLRQYKRERGNQGKKFTYKSIKAVYTIVFFEQSPSEFKAFPDTYIHKFEQKSDTGLEMDLLQKYIFVPLDIFKGMIENVDISNELDAWFVFLTCDEPEQIIRLIGQYPKFKPMYEEIYRLCCNMERVMQMFSEELRELDRNTVDLMIDEMQETITSQQYKIDELNDKLSELIRKQEESLQEINRLREELLIQNS